MTVRWCGIGHLSLAHVEEEGKVAMAILLSYLAPSGKEKRGCHTTPTLVRSPSLFMYTVSPCRRQPL